MTEELLYTSAPSGLKPGSAGFCVVMASQQLPPIVADQLERLSGYRHLAMPGTKEAQLNPVGWSHFKLSVGAKSYTVLARIADAGLDYTNRSNMIAHYLVLDGPQPAAGPAYVISRPGLMETSWNGPPRRVENGRELPIEDRPATVCRAWASATGDAGWGGVLAKTVVDPKRPPAYVVYLPGTNVLPLFEEAIALLPKSVRWQATFNTFTQKLANNVQCQWRAVVAGSPEDEQSQRQSGALRIDLTRPMPPAIGSEAEAARGGRELSTDSRAKARPAPGTASHADDAAKNSRTRPLNLGGSPDRTTAPTSTAREHESETISSYALASSRASQRTPPPRGQPSTDWRGEQVSHSRASKWIGTAIGVLVAAGIGFGAWSALRVGTSKAEQAEEHQSRRSSQQIAASKDSEPAESTISEPQGVNSIVVTNDTETKYVDDASSPSTKNNLDIAVASKVSSTIAPSSFAESRMEVEPAGKGPKRKRPATRNVDQFEYSETSIGKIAKDAQVELPAQFEDNADAYFVCPSSYFQGLEQSDQPQAIIEVGASPPKFRIADGKYIDDSFLIAEKKGRQLILSANTHASFQKRGLWCALIRSDGTNGIHVTRFIEPLSVERLRPSSSNTTGTIRFELPAIETVEDGSSEELTRLDLRIAQVECSLPGENGNEKFTFLADTDAGCVGPSTPIYSPELSKSWWQLIQEISSGVAVDPHTSPKLEFSCVDADERLELEPDAQVIVIQISRMRTSEQLIAAIKEAKDRIVPPFDNSSINTKRKALVSHKDDIAAKLREFENPEKRSQAAHAINEECDEALKHITNLQREKRIDSGEAEKLEATFARIRSQSSELNRAVENAHDFVARLSDIQIVKTRVFYEVRLSSAFESRIENNFTDITTKLDVVRIGDWDEELDKSARELVERLTPSRINIRVDDFGNAGADDNSSEKTEKPRTMPSGEKP